MIPADSRKPVRRQVRQAIDPLQPRAVCRDGIGPPNRQPAFGVRCLQKIIGARGSSTERSCSSSSAFLNRRLGECRSAARFSPRIAAPRSSASAHSEARHRESVTNFHFGQFAARNSFDPCLIRSCRTTFAEPLWVLDRIDTAVRARSMRTGRAVRARQRRESRPKSIPSMHLDENQRCRPAGFKNA